MRGHQTNNYTGVTEQLYKDHVLLGCKTYNVVALEDFTLSVTECYYRNWLLAFAHGRVRAAHLLLADLQQKGACIDNSRKNCIKRMGEHLNQLLSEKKCQCVL